MANLTHQCTPSSFRAPPTHPPTFTTPTPPPLTPRTDPSARQLSHTLATNCSSQPPSTTISPLSNHLFYPTSSTSLPRPSLSPPLLIPTKDLCPLLARDLLLHLHFLHTSHPPDTPPPPHSLYPPAPFHLTYDQTPNAHQIVRIQTHISLHLILTNA